MQLQKVIVPLILFVCLGISSLTGCGRKGQEQNEQKAEQEKNLLVNLEAIICGQI